MKILSLLIINFFLFNFSLAVEVKNFKIDNFSFETNLLDYFTKTAIDESKNCELRKGKDFCQLSIDLKKSTGIYDGVDLIFKQSNLKIHSLGGRIYFDTFESCLAEKEEATHFLSDLGGVTHLIVNEIGMYKEHPNKFNRDKIFYLLEEIVKDLKNYELELRIEELESKFAKDLSESTFNEIKELKKSQNIN